MRPRTLVGAVCACVLFLSWAGSALADTPPASDLTALASASPIGVVSGGVDGTQVRIAADLADVLDNGSRLRILPILGRGSLQNMADLFYLPGVDVGIIQSDVLAYAKAHRLYPGLGKSLQYICKLFDEKVHVLGAARVSTLQELNGQKVNVGPAGGDTSFTASAMFASLGITPEYTHFGQDEAVRRLEQGELAAIVDVTVEPARIFADLPPDKGLHFVPVPLTPALLNTYLPAELDHSNYPALVTDAAPVDTIAVGSLMAVYAWPPGSPRYDKLAKFVEAFFGDFRQFLQPPHLPQWRDVNLAAEIPGWTRFPPAQQWLARRATERAGGAAASQSDFEAFLNQAGGSAASHLSQEERDKLFQHFLDWRAQQRLPQ